MKLSISLPSCLFSFLLLFSLAGCPGSLTIEGLEDALDDDDDSAGDDDDATGDDDDATGDDDDDDDDPVVPSNCASSVQPNSPGQVRTYAGSAALTPGTSLGNCSFSWSGCEAIKLFDSSGLVCEVVWDVTGPCTDYDYNWQEQESEVLYDLTFTLNMLETTCTGDESGWVDDRIENQEWDYRLEWADYSQDLEILWAYPGDDEYSEWANTTFSADNFGVVTFDYVSGWESW